MDNGRRPNAIRRTFLRMLVGPIAMLAVGMAAPYFWLQPAVTGAGALLVLIGAAITVRQRYQADRRDQWWKRTQWALELLLTGEEDSIVIALDVLTMQVQAKVADKEDADFVAGVLLPAVDSYRGG